LKLFVGRCPSGITTDDLREYFSKFGELTDVYIPTPFRNFAFITYASQDEGRSALQADHVFKGMRLNVQERNEDTRQAKRDGQTDGKGNNTQYPAYPQQGYTTYTQNPNIQNMDPTLKTMLMQYLSGQ